MGKGFESPLGWAQMVRAVHPADGLHGFYEGALRALWLATRSTLRLGTQPQPTVET